MLVLEKKNNVAINSFENNKIETRHTRPLYVTNGIVGGIIGKLASRIVISVHRGRLSD